MSALDRRRLLVTSAAIAAGVCVGRRRAGAAGFDDEAAAAAAVLTEACASGQVTTAALHVARGSLSVSRGFGRTPSDAADPDAMFLLGSISKPIAVMALLTLFDHERFSLDDAVRRFLPDFTGDGRERITIRHLLTHVSGLPDQLPQNDRLRADHAPLEAFVEAAVRAPLRFPPGTRYGYSSMAILLASRIAEVVSGTGILELISRSVFEPLGMRRSAQGLGRFERESLVPCQVERAAPESGGGDPRSENWNWNSRYWRSLGAPWGGTHASAADVGRFLDEVLAARGRVLKPDTARLMTSNHNPVGLVPRGLGFALGGMTGPATAFGHTGSTGTIAWADPHSDTICVVLTSLPARAANPHPRDRAAAAIAG